MKGITCQELLACIPDGLLERLEEETAVNYQVKKLTGKVLFKLLIFTLLGSERASLRVMEELYNSAQFAVFSESAPGRIRHSGIGERLQDVQVDFFRQVFAALSGEFATLLNQQRFSGHYDIARFDSTLVSISSSLIRCGLTGFGKNKGDRTQIKYTLGVKNLLPQDAMVFTEQSAASEEVALRAAILGMVSTDDTIVVFDRGLQRRQTFAELDGQGIWFVTRLKNRVRYRTVGIHKHIAGRKSRTLRLEQDLIVRLKDEHEAWTNQTYRLIVARSRQSGEELIFLTNITALNAREITDIYRERWYIETFFRFLKQELSGKHLVSRSKNGITVMLYMTLIVALLLLVYKAKNGIPGYKQAKLRFMLELEMEIIEEIVVACNGDISRFRHLQRPHPT